MTDVQAQILAQLASPEVKADMTEALEAIAMFVDAVVVSQILSKEENDALISTTIKYGSCMMGVFQMLETKEAYNNGPKN